MKARVAVVGLGKMGLLHSSILSVLENAELVALCEKQSILRRFASKIISDIPFVASVEELAGMKLDAVYITTPESSHFPILKTIYDKGISHNLFVEKPLTASHSTAQELCELAARAGGVTMVGYNRRYSVTFGKVKKVLEDGVLGEVTSFEGHAFSSDFLGGAKLDSRSLARGRTLSDLGCHVIDLALWLFGPLEASSGLLEPRNEPEDWVNFKVRSLENHRNLEGEFRISRCMKDYRLPEIGLWVKGSKGIMKADEDKVEIKLDGSETAQWHKHDLGDDVPFFIGGTEYFREDTNFINSIIDGSRAEPDFQAASLVEAIIDQVTHSTKES